MATSPAAANANDGSTTRNNRMEARSELSGDMVMDDVPEDTGFADGEQGDHYYESDAQEFEHGGNMSSTLEASK